ncbi:MAG: shikimate dehydrogenase [Solirubrobacteraceae bacterium]|nr:shikimate dehydrogenase [Solirubrobacteraceae bacterium]
MLTGHLAGVLGWPVAHSRSPAIHEAAYAAVGLADWRYQKLPVPPEAFAETARALPGAGFAGANVTSPHKAAAAELADELTPAAREIGAANTLTFAGGRVHADNTDAPGFLAALADARPGGPPAAALVLGAGGTARAVVWALRHAGVGDVMVWNRTPERAHELCAELGGRAVTEAEPADVLVNCTAVGLDGAGTTFAQLPLTVEALGGYECVLDFVYSDEVTELMAAAREAGAGVVDGLELLVRQGALSFEAWTGTSAPLDVMRSAARNA